MKILLVHPDDSVEGDAFEPGSWATGRWDLVIDLGWAGRAAYLRETERRGFRITSLYDLLDHQEHRRRLRDMLAFGLNQLLDSESPENIDWWDLFSVLPYQKLEQLLLLSALAEQIPEQAEIFATRPHFAVEALQILLYDSCNARATTSSHIKTLAIGRSSRFPMPYLRYWRAAAAFRPAQLAEIAFDKWDTDYRLRRRFAPRPGRPSMPAILLPSAYANVSRVQVAYARMLPQRHFLLVVTRRNGRIPNLPPNVEVRSLASYAKAPGSATEEEGLRLLDGWQNLRNKLFASHRVLALANRLGVFDGFESFLKTGLRVRDAWREVFLRNPILAVLSADENNPHTRLPVLLARSRNLRTVFADHGALNMSLAIRRPASDMYLMKGEMAADYSVNWCGLPAGKVVVGGPSLPPATSASTPTTSDAARDWIVFYSEEYELSAGRTRAFYKELLPEVCQLASRTHSRVIVKLHPFESFRTRKALVENVLSSDQRKLVTLRTGAMTPDLFARAWCSLTVESSVAIENTLNGVPCFLCSWFDGSWYDYGKQFAKYGAGYPLDSPQRIRDIPKLMEQIRITDATQQRLQTTISAKNLESILCGE